MSFKEAEVLSEARDELVKMRRDHAKVLAAGFERGKTERSVDEIAKLQAAIEAIDRAIQDEKRSGS
jgi:hypothetical protein